MSGDCSISAAFFDLKELAKRGWDRQRLTYHDGRWFVTVTHPIAHGSDIKPTHKFWQHKTIQSNFHDDIDDAIGEVVRLCQQYEEKP